MAYLSLPRGRLSPEQRTSVNCNVFLTGIFKILELDELNRVFEIRNNKVDVMPDDACVFVGS